MMAVRLLEMRRVLKPEGSIYLHCDPFASHYLKQLLDVIFGARNNRKEVVWCFERPSGFKTQAKNWLRRHELLLYYVKGKKWTFNKQYEPYEESYVQLFNREDEDGKYWLRAGEKRRLGRGYGITDVWTDINSLQTPAYSKKESTGYPTQKPLALLERIIQASSNEGDWILDPFCGCATACVAAEALGRKWVGIDISPKAAELVNTRLQQSMGTLFHHRLVTARTDIPRRTDIAAPKNYRQNKHILFGQQEGVCNGCKMDFPFKIFEVDHIIPQARGGADHLENLQLLCPHCNRVKGDRSQEYLISQLSAV
jgi:site-specific DNA-methyltransferase (adenine-specific)